MKIIKRTGEEQEFDASKIRNAINKANATVPPLDALTDDQVEKIVSYVTEACSKMERPMGVEEIQDLVEHHLMAMKAFDVAKHYIVYRRDREKIRLNKKLKEKLFASNVQNQNANLDEKSFGGRKGEAMSFIAKEYALNNLMSKKAVRNHLNNEVYVHDLDSYAIGCHNCTAIPFDKLLSGGFKIRQTDIRPAGSINTAFQLVAVIFQIQSLQQFGGVSATHLDWTMVPYVRLSFYKHYRKACDLLGIDMEALSKAVVKETPIADPVVYTDEKARDAAMSWTKDELEQAVEGMYHNLNSLQSRSGDQLPFTSLNYGTCTLKEGQMVTEALLNGSLKGVGKFGRTSIFPCGIFQCMSGVNRKPGDPNYDLFRLALKSTAKRLYPNYANVDWSGNAGYDRDNPSTYFSTMGCHGWDTPIRMYDGSVKKVQDIVVGDKLRSFTDEPRVVQSIIRGVDTLYQVEQAGAMTYTVNEGHVLVLLDTSVPPLPEERVYALMTVHDYLALPEERKQKMMGVKMSGFGVTYHHIVVSKIYDADFYGFELDGDRLYLLSDGTVTHNCRTANGADINQPDPKLKQLKDGRGNICPVTVILPTLAMECKVRYDRGGQYDEDKCVEAFMRLLDRKIGEAKDMLVERFEHICSQSPASAQFMYENGTMYGYKPEEGIRSALKHGTLVIGQLGLAEALQILIGCDHTTDKGMELAKRIEQLFKDRCAEYKRELRLNFGVYYTPAENLCYTAMNKFREKYGIIPNVSDRPYFTNSTHVPVWRKMTPFEKIDIEAQLTGYSSAGCITYVELDSSVQHNTQALEDLVNYAMDKDIPYFAINVPSDLCLDCGYQGDISESCPECRSANVQRLRRVTGYLTGDYKTAFNKGKQAEADDRVSHSDVEA